LLSADVRYDDSSVYGGKTTGRLGWGYELGHGLTARALAGTTFRAPDFNDLYYPYYGVLSLRPERGRSIEVGLDWRSGDSTVSATAYRNRVRDLIDDVYDSLCPDATYLYGCASNIGKAKLEGVSLSAAHRLGALSLRATADVLSARDEGTDARLDRRARHQGTFNAEYQIDAWSFGGTLLAVGDRPDGQKHLGGYSTLDLQTRWRFAPQWQLEAKVLNVGDRDVELVRDTRALGRQAWLALRYSGVGL
jgi:vitamin B12 transporter